MNDRDSLGRPAGLSVNTMPFLARARAYAVHLLTASGVVAAFLAVAELLDEAPDERVVFAWLVVAVLIDAVDGTLARAWDVKRLARTSTGGRSTTSSIPDVHVRAAAARLADGLGAFRPRHSWRGVDRTRAARESAWVRARRGQGRGGRLLPRLSKLLEHRRVLRGPRVLRIRRHGAVAERHGAGRARGTDRLAGALPLPEPHTRGRGSCRCCSGQRRGWRCCSACCSSTAGCPGGWSACRSYTRCSTSRYRS